jgi:hypothetical protein
MLPARRSLVHLTLLIPDYKGHFLGAPAVNGREAFKQFISMYGNGLTNRHGLVEDILIEGCGRASSPECAIPAGSIDTSVLGWLRHVYGLHALDSLVVIRPAERRERRPP